MDPERIDIGRPGDLPGVEVVRVDRSRRLWRWYHETYAVSTVLHTCSEWVYRRATRQVRPGAVILTEPGEIHFTSKLAGSSDFRILFIDPDILERAAAELGILGGPPRWGAPQVDNPALFRPLVRLHACLDRPATALERQSRFAGCLRQLLTRYAETAPPRPLDGGERAAVARARALLHEHYAEDVTLSDLARAAGVTRFHLLRAFAAEVGLPPHAYQVQLRIAAARRLIAAGTLLAAAATETGFVDQSHLTRHFHRIVGVTPGRYAAGARPAVSCPLRATRHRARCPTAPTAPSPGTAGR